MSPAETSAAFGSFNQIATVRIELRDSDPVIWRRVEVPPSITLKVLHEVIQAAIGWFDYHLWEFAIAKRPSGDTVYPRTRTGEPSRSLTHARSACARCCGRAGPRSITSTTRRLLGAPALTYQFAGQSASGLPPDGEWRCLLLSQVQSAQLRGGPWHSRPHNQPQTCVDIIDVEVDC